MNKCENGTPYLQWLISVLFGGTVHHDTVSIHCSLDEYFSDLANWLSTLIYFTMYGTLLAAFSLASCRLCAIAVNHNQHGDELLESGGNSINDYIG